VEEAGYVTQNGMKQAETAKQSGPGQ